MQGELAKAEWQMPRRKKRPGHHRTSQLQQRTLAPVPEEVPLDIAAASVGVSAVSAGTALSSATGPAASRTTGRRTPFSGPSALCVVCARTLGGPREAAGKYCSNCWRGWLAELHSRHQGEVGSAGVTSSSQDLWRSHRAWNGWEDWVSSSD